MSTYTAEEVKKLLEQQREEVVDEVDKQFSYIVFADGKPTATTYERIIAKARAVPLVKFQPDQKPSDRCHRCDQRRDSSTHDYDHGFEEPIRVEPLPKTKKELTEEQISKAVEEAMERSKQLVKDALKLGRSMSGLSPEDLKLILR